jgi:hypothetical protein
MYNAVGEGSSNPEMLEEMDDVTIGSPADLPPIKHVSSRIGRYCCWRALQKYNPWAVDRRGEFTMMSSKELNSINVSQSVNEELFQLRSTLRWTVYVNRVMIIPLYWTLLVVILKYLLPLLEISDGVELVTTLMALNILVMASYNILRLESIM